MSYALDIFGEKVANKSRIRTFNCTSSEVPVQFHQCTLGGAFCPVDPENIRDAMLANDWRLSDKICHALSSMSKAPKEVALHNMTIWVLGGSVTLGMYSQGCCCNLDSTCPLHDTELMDDIVPHEKFCVPYSFKNRQPGGCGWLKLFKCWVEMRFPGVQVKSLARGGTTTVSMFLSEVRLYSVPQCVAATLS